MSTPRTRSVHLLLVIVQVCFASLAIIGKIALREIPPPALVGARVLGGVLVFSAIVLLRAPSAWRFDRRDLPRFVACGLFGVAANQSLFMLGLERTTAINASVLGTTIPVFTLAFAMALKTEALVPLRILGLAIAFSGALALVGVDRFSLADEHLVGNLLVLANSLSYGLFLVVVRPLASRYQPMMVVLLLFACALPFVSVPALGPWIELAPRLETTSILLIAFIVAVPTVGAYSLNQMAMERARASLVAVYIYLQPVIATIAAFVFLDEVPTFRTALSYALIFIGVYLSHERAHR